MIAKNTGTSEKHRHQYESVNCRSDHAADDRRRIVKIDHHDDPLSTAIPNSAMYPTHTATLKLKPVMY